VKAVEIALHRLQLIFLLRPIADALARRHPPAQYGVDVRRTRRIGRAENRILAILGLGITPNFEAAFAILDPQRLVIGAGRRKFAGFAMPYAGSASVHDAPRQPAARPRNGSGIKNADRRSFFR
jgi:hypothetical protein